MKNATVNLTRLLAAVGLTDDHVTHMAFETRAWKRVRKIRPADVLKHLCQESIAGTVSYNDLATAVAVHTGVNASRQAYAQHMNPSVVALFKAFLEIAMRAKIAPAAEAQAGLGGLTMFRRILIQDSTVIPLPPALFPVYSGVNNGNRVLCNARIQAIYDLRSGRFIDFRIDPYSRNDFAATRDLIPMRGDLILRDRGYFVVDAVQKQTDAGADSINRYTHRTPLYDPATKTRIDLPALLSRQGTLDMEVLVGSRQTLRCRLVAAPVSEETANRRRMKAWQENKLPPSKTLLKLMSWTIMLTTIFDDAVGFEDILRLYSLRWRIETIFKTWKSHFAFAKLHTVSDCQFQCLILARLLVVTLLFSVAYHPLSKTVKTKTGNTLSLMKFMRYATRSLIWAPLLLSNRAANKIVKAISRYCSYEKRKRYHFMANMEPLRRNTACATP